MASQKPSPRSEVRLQAFLAACGIGSRRACEALIDQGLVSVDGEVVRRQGVTVDPARQAVCVRGAPVHPQPHVHLALHKPPGVVSTVRDPRGRRTVCDLVPGTFGRLYPVGRLDRDSEGLILLTNHGRFAHRMMHPRHHVPKVYEVWVSSPLHADRRRALLRGIVDGGETLRALSITPVGDRTRRYQVVLGEGRNRQLRRMFDACGIEIRRLKRTAIGPLKLGGLPAGAWRELHPREVRRLEEAAGIPGLSPAPPAGLRRE